MAKCVHGVRVSKCIKCMYQGGSVLRPDKKVDINNKWCRACSCRVVNGVCMNSKCSTRQ